MTRWPGGSAGRLAGSAVFAAAVALLGLAHEADARDYDAISYPLSGGNSALGSVATTLAFTNNGAAPDDAEVRQAGALVATVTVPAGGVAFWDLPTRLPYTSGITSVGVYHVKTGPQTAVTQFAPTAFQVSADATRLLERRETGRDYVAVGGPGMSGSPTWITAVPAANATISFDARGAGTCRDPVTLASVTGGSWSVPAGRALHLACTVPYGLPGGVDGMTLRSSVPAAAYVGDPCNQFEGSACDHLQDQLWPLATDGREFALCGSRDVARFPGYDLVRISGDRAATVSFDPAPAEYPGGTATLAGTGDWLQFKMREPTYLRSNATVVVAATYGKDAPGNVAPGDPALMHVMPRSQWREEYRYWVPDRWAGFVIAAVPATAPAATGGGVITTRPIGSTDLVCITATVSAGLHDVTSSEPMDATVMLTMEQGAQWYGAAYRLPVPPPPAASFTAAEATTCSGSLATFDGSGSTGDPPIVAWDWTFGDGGTGTGAVVTHSYAAAGTYLVTLTVTDADGGTGTLARSFVSSGDGDCPPVLEPIPDITVRVGQEVRVCVTGSDPDGDALAYWMAPLRSGMRFDGRCLRWTPGQGHVGVWGLGAGLVANGVGRATAFQVTVIPADATSPADSDRDGVADIQDNCPATPNRGQEDADTDGAGDVCDLAGDALVGDADHAVWVPRPGDLDGDGVPDGEDVCPQEPDPPQLDADSDRAGDACDIDADGDSVAESGPSEAFLDNCPWAANPGQEDADGDGAGDVCDQAATDVAGSGAGGDGPGQGAPVPAAGGLAVAAGLALAGALSRRRRA